MRSRALGGLIVLAAAVPPAADGAAHDEFSVVFGDDGASYAIVHREDGSDWGLTYRTPDGAAFCTQTGIGAGRNPAGWRRWIER